MPTVCLVGRSTPSPCSQTTRPRRPTSQRVKEHHEEHARVRVRVAPHRKVSARRGQTAREEVCHGRRSSHQRLRPPPPRGARSRRWSSRRSRPGGWRWKVDGRSFKAVEGRWKGAGRPGKVRPIESKPTEPLGEKSLYLAPMRPSWRMIWHWAHGRQHVAQRQSSRPAQTVAGMLSRCRTCLRTSIVRQHMPHRKMPPSVLNVMNAAEE